MPPPPLLSTRRRKPTTSRWSNIADKIPNVALGETLLATARLPSGMQRYTQNHNLSYDPGMFFFDEQIPR